MRTKTLEIANTKLRMAVEFRPIIQFSGNKIFRYEALARFFNSDGFQTATQQTIYELDRLGLINDIADFLFDTICDVLKKKESLAISFNLAQLLVNDIDHLSALYKKCQLHNIETRRIEISSKLDKNQLISSLPFLQQAKAYGFMTALDDYSDENTPDESLQLFNFDTIKIEHSCLESIATDTVKCYRLQRFINKFIASGVNVICEGVKKSADPALLNKYNQIGMQGYLFYRTLTFRQLQLLEDF